MQLNEFLTEFRKKYKAEDIINKMESLRDLKVLVIGDAIIDQYHYCSSIGKSPKDNIMVVKYLSEETFAGGVLAAANHIAGFCDDVQLVTCLGKQETHEDFIRKRLKKNIHSKFFYREDTYTPIKRRFVEPNKLTKLFGVSILDDYDLPGDVANQVCDYLKIHSYDLVLVTDYGHGFINQSIVGELKPFLAINTQTNTDNAGFNLISKYLSADYICLDEPETRLAFQSKYGKLEALIQRIAVDHNCPSIAITHGQYDTTVWQLGKFYKIPTFSNGIKDTTGAGDAFLAISSLCVARGFPMDMVGFIGNCVGALKVKRVCNRSPIEQEELFSFIKELLWTMD